ncbi:MAG: hypothetical protein WDN69_02415 [Aliidongia sp.]
MGELNAANLGNDIQQAFTGPLIDQNGNFVFYEILIDPNEVTYLCDNKLYNINGQIDFSKKGGKVDMPVGHPLQDWSGSFELKLAWKIMEPGKDDAGRFFVEDAYVIDRGADGKPVQRKSRSGWSACMSAIRAKPRRNGSGRRSSRSTILTSTRSRTRTCMRRSTMRVARSAR